VVKGEWQGLEAVFKVRKPLPYRLPALDSTIRRQRTAREADMLRSAKSAGVRAPTLYFVDPVSSTLVMEYIRGPRLKEQVAGMSPSEIAGVFELLGHSIGRLHGRGIMHGDLTTSNLVLHGLGLVLLDFGLALRTTRIEDHAVDLRLIKEILVGAHSSIAEAALDAIISGYTAELGPIRTRAVLKQLKGIERRGRYARMA
jgi:TP53 regulating kinase-like protein